MPTDALQKAKSLLHNLSLALDELSTVKDNPTKLVSNRKKLSRKEADEIRRLSRAGFTNSELAEAFDVNKTTISRIVRGIYYA